MKLIEPLDLSDMMPPEIAGLPSAIRAIMPEVGKAAHEELTRLAKQNLKTSRQVYQGALDIRQHEDGPRTSTVITLDGMIPNMIEHGWRGGDVKDKILAGGRARMGQSGERYAVVRLDRGKNKRRSGQPRSRHHVPEDIEAATVAPARSRRSGGRGIYRTITERQEGWIHPGIEGRHFFDEARAFVAKRAGELIEQAIRGKR